LRCYQSDAYETLGTTFARGHSGSAKPFSLFKRHGRIDIRQKTLKACWCTNYTPSLYACHILEKAKLRKREERVCACVERKGNVRVRSVLVSVGFGLLLHGAAVLCCRLRHTRSLSERESTHILATLSLLYSLSLFILACMLCLCSRTGM